MSLSVTYYITDPDGVYLDWAQRNAGFSILGKEALIYGGDGDDSVYVQTATSATLTGMGLGNDRMYLSGSFAQYSQAIDQNTGVYTFTRIAGLAPGQAEVVRVAASEDDDVLYFSDGHISLNSASESQRLYVDDAYQPIQQSWLAEGGTPGGIATPITSAATAKPALITSYITTPDGLDLPSLAQPGQQITVQGSDGVDTVHVADGTQVDASQLGLGDDRVYLRGRLAEYAQSIDQNTGVYTFTRMVAGQTEWLKIAAGEDNDVLYFADGHIVMNGLENTQLFDQEGSVYNKIQTDWLVSGGTPYLTNIASIAVTSNPGPGHIYSAGKVMEFTVAFKQPVTITGAPQLAFTLGATGKTATMKAGQVLTEISSVVFEYTVADPDTDTDGIDIVANALSLNGGHITLVQTQGDAPLLNTVLAGLPDTLVDGIAPGAPVFDSILSGGRKVIPFSGSQIEDTSPKAPVSLRNTGAKPGDTLQILDTPKRVIAEHILTNAEIVSGSLVLDIAPLSNGQHSLAARVIDMAGNSGALSPELKFKVDNDGPSLDKVEVFGRDSSNNELTRQLMTGDKILVMVSASQAVKVRAENQAVIGKPTLLLDLNGSIKVATYDAAQSTGKKLAFVYTIAQGDNDFTGGITLAGLPAILLPKGVFLESENKYSGSVTLTLPDALPNNLVVDTRAPNTLSLVAAGSSVEDGTYQLDSIINAAELGPGQFINFTVAFNKAVTGVKAKNFSLTDATGAALAGATPYLVINGSGATYKVSVAGLTGLTNSSVRLTMSSGDGITDLAGNALVAPQNINDSFKVDSLAPLLTDIVRGSRVTRRAETAADSLDFLVTFSETINPASLRATDFALKLNGTVLNTVTIAAPVSLGNNQYKITVGGKDVANANGKLSLALADDFRIDDMAGNRVLSVLPAAAQSYLMDNTAPLLDLNGSKEGVNAIVQLPDSVGPNGQPIRVKISDTPKTASSPVRLQEDSTIPSVEVRISGILNGSSEKLYIGAIPIALGGTTKSTAVSINGSPWTFTYTSDAGNPDKGVLTFTSSVEGGTSSDLTQALIRNLAYANTASKISQGDRLFDFVLTDAAGNTSTTRWTLSGDITGPIIYLNGQDAGQDRSPARVDLAAVGSVGGVRLRSDAKSATVTESSGIDSVKVTLSGLTNGASEMLRVGNTDLAADGSDSLKKLVNDGVGDWSVRYSAATESQPAYFTFSKGVTSTGAVIPATTAQVQTLINSLAYRNTATNGVDGVRTVTVSAVDHVGNVTEHPAVAQVVLNTVAPTVATRPVETRDVDGDGILGDQFVLNFSEPVEVSRLDTSSLRLSDNRQLGSGARITAIKPFALEGISYATRYLVISGPGADYTTGTTLTVAASGVVDTSRTSATSDVVFTMTDILPPAPPSSPTIISGDNLINAAERKTPTAITYSHKQAVAGDELRVYRDGALLKVQPMDVNADRTGISLSESGWGPSDGVVVLSATIRDAAGNISAASSPKQVTIDTFVEPLRSSTVVLDKGAVGIADRGDVVRLTFAEKVKLDSGALSQEFGKGYVLKGVGLSDGFSTQWDVTLGESATLAGGQNLIARNVLDIAGNSKDLQFSTSIDLYNTPAPPVIDNVAGNNVVTSSERSKAQPVTLKLDRAKAGDVIHLYMDGMDAGTATVLTDGQETAQIEIAANRWGADGTRVLSATIERGTGTIVNSLVPRSVYISADSAHWASKDVIWFDPDAIAAGAMQQWKANTEDTVFSNGFSGAYSAIRAVTYLNNTPQVSTTETTWFNLMGFKNGHAMVSNYSNTADGFVLFSNAAIVPSNYMGASGLSATGQYGSLEDIKSGTWPALGSLADWVYKYEGTSPRQLIYGSDGYQMWINETVLDNGLTAGQSGTFSTQRGPAYVARLTPDYNYYAVDPDTRAWGPIMRKVYGQHETNYAYGQLVKSQVNVGVPPYAERIGIIGKFDTPWVGSIGDVAYYFRDTTANENQEFATYQAEKYLTQGNRIDPVGAGRLYDLSFSTTSTILMDDVLTLNSSALGVGNDTVITAGSDYVATGSGSDVIQIKDQDFRYIDGGLGFDTLALHAAYDGPSTIILADNVSNARGNSGDKLADARVNAAGYHKLMGLEAIDLSQAPGAQTLTVAAADVNQLSETNSLYVKLGANDVLLTKGLTGSPEYGYFLNSFANNEVYDRHWTGIDNGTPVDLYARGGDLPPAFISATRLSNTVSLSFDQVLIGQVTAKDFTLSSGQSVTQAVLDGHNLSLTLTPSAAGAPPEELTLTYNGTGLTDGNGEALRYTQVVIGSSDSGVLKAGPNGVALFGNAGNDKLEGGDGADLLLGGPGDDILTGGLGADTFRWIAGESSRDTVTDFNKSQGDKIDLSDMLAGFEVIPANVGGFLQLTKAEVSNDAILKIDDGGDGNFVTPVQVITFTNGWTAGGLSAGLVSLMEQRVLIA
ncbi:type I secretion C-terminal target domain-containing protein [Pseudomonas yamanorum]|uniref:calcium-binding protein n=1 Tax=Pseudomonas yamanorum TaxID=515393 RepID=UPI002ED05FCB|nr:type I secretion C-terminal target domain-containing protein [Pseudomonas yamanorum]